MGGRWGRPWLLLSQPPSSPQSRRLNSVVTAGPSLSLVHRRSTAFYSPPDLGSQIPEGQSNLVVLIYSFVLGRWLLSFRLNHHWVQGSRQAPFMASSHVPWYMCTLLHANVWLSAVHEIPRKSWHRWSSRATQLDKSTTWSSVSDQQP